MKIIITESQKEKIHNFLNSYLEDALNEGGVSKLDSFIIIWAENDEVLMEHDSYDGRLFVDKSFINKLKSWSPFNEDELYSIIKYWFSGRFNVKIKYVE